MRTPIRIAAIDIGTNAAKLLVADVFQDGELSVVADEMRMVRLGAGIDATGVVAPESWKRLREVLRAFKQVVARLGADDLVVAGTSASRDVRNARHLVDWVKEETALHYTILSGEEEAEWSFRGAAVGLPGKTGPYTSLDIGGGSTEITQGWPGNLKMHSVNVGSVRLTERYFSRQPPPPSEVSAAAACIESLLQETRINTSYPLVGASLTQRLLVLIEHGGARAVHHSPAVLSASAVRAWRERLLGMARHEVLALLPDQMAGREDVFPAAVLILDCVMRRYGFARTIVSKGDLRHGLVLRQMGLKGTMPAGKGL